jgi:hypothetical protein
MRLIIICEDYTDFPRCIKLDVVRWIVVLAYPALH